MHTTYIANLDSHDPSVAPPKKKENKGMGGGPEEGDREMEGEGGKK